MAPARQLLGNVLMRDVDDEMEEEQSEEASIGPFW